MSDSHKKLIAFDINLDWKRYEHDERRYKDLPLVYSLFTRAYNYQTPVIVTSGCLIDVIDLANHHQIDKGYIVASGGAIIYDIAAKEVIKKIPLTTDEIQTIVHHGIMQGVNIAIYTPDKKFMYVSNAVAYNTIRNNAYSPYDVIPDYATLKTIMGRTDIVDIAYVNLEKFSDDAKNIILLDRFKTYYNDEENNLVYKTNTTSRYIHIANKKSTKLNAIYTVMALTKVELVDDILYCAGSCINNECYITFRNSIIANNPDFINVIGNNKQHKYLDQNFDKLDEKLGLETNSFWK